MRRLKFLPASYAHGSMRGQWPFPLTDAHILEKKKIKSELLGKAKMD